MAVELGYSTTTRTWPSDTRSPRLNHDEMTRVRRDFIELYANAIADLKDTEVDDYPEPVVHISLVDDDNTDPLRRLRSELVLQRELRGRVELSGQPVTDGDLGTAVDVLQVAVGATGAIGILASSVVLWMKQQTADIKLKIRANGRTIEVDAKRVKNVSGENLERFARSIEEKLQDYMTSEQTDEP